MSRTPGTQKTARLLLVIPPRTTNSTAPIVGQMISPARLDTKKQCCNEPQPGNGGDAGEPAADEGDWRADEPWRRTPQEISKFLWHRFALPNVWLPHPLAVALGLALFVAAAALNASGLEHLHL